MKLFEKRMSSILTPLTSASAISRFRDRTHKFELVARDSWFFFVHKDDWFIKTIRPEDRNLSIAKLNRRMANSAPGHNKLELSGVDNFIKSFSKEIKDVIYMDIGANYGQTAVRIQKILRNLGVKYQIYSFEPGVSADCLAVNVDMNKCEGVEIFDAAFSDIDGFIPIFAMDGHTEDNKIVNAAKEATVFPVRSIRLDTACDAMRSAVNRGSVFFKIDTQGAEVEVLKGAKQIISDHQFLGLLEFSPLSISSRIKPAEWLKELQESMHVIGCDPRQNTKAKVGQSTAEIEAFVDDVISLRMKFCDIMLVSHNHPKIKLIKTLFEKSGVTL